MSKYKSGMLVAVNKKCYWTFGGKDNKLILPKGTIIRLTDQRFAKFWNFYYKGVSYKYIINEKYIDPLPKGSLTEVIYADIR